MSATPGDSAPRTTPADIGTRRGEPRAARGRTRSGSRSRRRGGDGPIRQPSRPSSGRSTCRARRCGYGEAISEEPAGEPAGARRRHRGGRGANCRRRARRLAERRGSRSGTTSSSHLRTARDSVSQLSGRGPAAQPGGAAPIQRLDLRAPEPWHVSLDVVADPRLQVREMAVALGELAEQLAVELQSCARIDGSHPVLLVDRLAQHEAPAAVSLLEEVVEAAGAHNVDLDVVDDRPLRDRHLDLGDRPRARDLDRLPAVEVQDLHALLPPRLAPGDELVGRPLGPRRHHPPVVPPDRAEPLPVAGVAPDDPVLDQLADLQAVGLAHGRDTSPRTAATTSSAPGR